MYFLIVVLPLSPTLPRRPHSLRLRRHERIAKRHSGNHGGSLRFLLSLPLLPLPLRVHEAQRLPPSPAHELHPLFLAEPHLLRAFLEVLPRVRVAVAPSAALEERLHRVQLQQRLLQVRVARRLVLDVQDARQVQGVDERVLEETQRRGLFVARGLQSQVFLSYHVLTPD